MLILYLDNLIIFRWPKSPPSKKVMLQIRECEAFIENNFLPKPGRFGSGCRGSPPPEQRARGEEAPSIIHHPPSIIPPPPSTLQPSDAATLQRSNDSAAFTLLAQLSPADYDRIR